jgi:hypothetical protein
MNLVRILFPGSELVLVIVPAGSARLGQDVGRGTGPAGGGLSGPAADRAGWPQGEPLLPGRQYLGNLRRSAGRILRIVQQFPP